MTSLRAAGVIGALALSFAGLGITPAQASALCRGVAMDDVAGASEQTSEAGATRLDRGGRVIAPVMVNGQGPFRFIVDTGANRSAVSSDLARALGLSEVGVGNVHTVHEVTSVPLAQVASIQYGALGMGAAQLPVLGSAVLAGQDGLLGVDALRGRRLVLDFENRCIEIAEAQSARRLRGWTSVRGDLRHGHLMLTRGAVRNRRINVLIDTGSSASLANPALLRHLQGIAVDVEEVRENPVRVLTAGAPILLERAIFLPSVEVGAVEAQNITAFVGDFHIFDLWDLTDQPTLLVGMDVLSYARGLAIDYHRGSIHFRIVDDAPIGSRLSGARSSSSLSLPN